MKIDLHRPSNTKKSTALAVEGFHNALIMPGEVFPKFAMFTIPIYIMYFCGTLFKGKRRFFFALMCWNEMLLWYLFFIPVLDFIFTMCIYSIWDNCIIQHGILQCVEVLLIYPQVHLTKGQWEHRRFGRHTHKTQNEMKKMCVMIGTCTDSRRTPSPPCKIQMSFNCINK